MQSRDDRIETLARANAARQEGKRQAVLDALERARRRKAKVSINSVAREAGVSRNFVYSHADLRARIQEANAGQSHRMAGSSFTPATEASLRARLVTALDSLEDSRKEARELRTKVERLTAELAKRVS